MVHDSVRDRREGVSTPDTPGLVTMVERAVRRKCCVCGAGRLFRRWTTMVERCPSCGYRFERSEGQFIGAVGINTVVTFAVLLVVLVTGFIVTAPDIPAVTLSVIGVAIGVLVPILLYPFSKTIWTAIDLAMTPLEPGEAPQLGDAPRPGDAPVPSGS